MVTVFAPLLMEQESTVTSELTQLDKELEEELNDPGLYMVSVMVPQSKPESRNTSICKLVCWLMVCGAFKAKSIPNYPITWDSMRSISRILE